MPRFGSAIMVSAFVCSIASVASAQAGKPSGLALGLRLGYSLPMGKEGEVVLPGATASGSGNLSDDFKGRIPIWIDAGYRINPQIYVGAFFQYGFLSVNTDRNAACTQGIDCSTHDIQVGANLHYHILPDSSFDPWLGAGLGYEWVSLSAKGTVTVPGLGSLSSDQSLLVKGFQFLNLQAGGDFKATPDFGVGPFISFSMGQYSSYSMTDNTTSQSVSGDLQNKGMHEWLTFGVRGQFNL
jgi:outer membrane protein W